MQPSAAALRAGTWPPPDTRSTPCASAPPPPSQPISPPTPHRLRRAGDMPRLYTWDQTPSEVRIFVPVEGDFDYKRDVKFVAKGGRHVTLSVGPKTYMDGRLFAQVDQDMAEYACSTHEEGGVKGLEVQLEKVVPAMWRTCLEGEEEDGPEPSKPAAAAAAEPAKPPAAASAPAGGGAAAATAEPPPETKRPGSASFTEAANAPPPAVKGPPAGEAAALADDRGGLGGVCLAAVVVCGVLGWAYDHWQKNQL